jgi:hypothetical protein
MRRSHASTTDAPPRAPEHNVPKHNYRSRAVPLSLRLSGLTLCREPCVRVGALWHHANAHSWDVGG